MTLVPGGAPQDRPWRAAAPRGQDHRVRRTTAGRGETRVDTEIDTEAAPSGAGCVECDASGGWWFHLRRCTACGHIGCCDSSPSGHATAHAGSSGHPVMTSYEPGEY